MPQGIVATVSNGFATLDFVDPRLRGQGLQKLLEIGGPETIETITRRGPRRQYRVPEGNAREAGLLDQRARGLSADGTPDDDHAGGTGTTQDSGTAGDTGFATATKNADPNIGSSITGADGPAATGTVDWHAPVDQYTSENAFVGTVSNAAVLHGRGQVFTGTGTSVGGDMAHPPLHSDLIDFVKEDAEGMARSQAAREPATPAAVVANALRSQPGALGSDPGGYAPQPGKAPAAVVYGAQKPVAATNPFSRPDAPANAVGQTSGDPGRPAGLPEGKPDDGWKRSDLNAYAEWKGVTDADTLPNKAEVLTAIARAG